MKSEEQKYWMKHYPHEAETIITMCDLFDHTEDESTKAQIDYVLGVLREQEKYAWHDLREDPKDLPVDSRVVEVAMSGVEGDVRYSHGCTTLLANGHRVWAIGIDYPVHKITHWRYIEPFGEVEE